MGNYYFTRRIYRFVSPSVNPSLKNLNDLTGIFIFRGLNLSTSSILRGLFSDLSVEYLFSPTEDEREIHLRLNAFKYAFTKLTENYEKGKINERQYKISSQSLATLFDSFCRTFDISDVDPLFHAIDKKRLKNTLIWDLPSGAKGEVLTSFKVREPQTFVGDRSILSVVLLD